LYLFLCKVLYKDLPLTFNLAICKSFLLDSIEYFFFLFIILEKQESDYY